MNIYDILNINMSFIHLFSFLLHLWFLVLSPPCGFSFRQIDLLDLVFFFIVLLKGYPFLSFFSLISGVKLDFAETPLLVMCEIFTAASTSFCTKVLTHRIQSDFIFALGVLYNSIHLSVKTACLELTCVCAHVCGVSLVSASLVSTAVG